MPKPSESELYVHLLPGWVRPEQFRGGWVVVIDAIRASTTIVHALDAGAASVVVCEEVDEARSNAAAAPPNTCLLAGERGGARIEGFGLGNSPAEYTPAVCRGKTIAFTTTNGTKALAHAGQAARVLVGALVNRRAICRELEAWRGPIHLLCAGREGGIAFEDALAAGAIVEGFAGAWVPGNDAAPLVRDAFLARAGDLVPALRETVAARQLAALGLEGDVDDVGRLDRFDVAPVYDPTTGRIVSG